MAKKLRFRALDHYVDKLTEAHFAYDEGVQRVPASESRAHLAYRRSHP